MKNPWKKKDNTVLIASVIIGSVTAAAVTYLFLTETGATVRDQLAKQVDRLRDLITGENKDEPVVDHLAYTQKHHKAPKTDREALLKHEILHDQGAHPDAATES